ncbi:MAG: hypothetical protein WCH20_05095 [Nitrospira sp.]
MRSFISKRYLSIAVLILALGGLVGCDYETRAVGGANSVRAVKMNQDLRDLWLGHIYWVQHAVLYNAAKSLAERDVAEKEVVANAKQIANTVTPFYGEARSGQLFALLVGHVAALKEYSEATVAGNTRLQDAALTGLASNADHLTKDTVPGLISAHVANHVLQVNQYKKKEYAKLEETWPMMRQHVYLIADTLTTALVKQFPDKFS